MGNMNTETKMVNMNKKEYNVEYIYNDEIDQEELDGILKDTEINPNCHQQKDKENDEYA